MRRIALPALLFCLVLCNPVVAQPAPYGSLDGNIGTWKWEKQQPSNNDEEETGEDADQGRGETSWERMNAERNAEFEPPPSEDAPKSLTPLEMWRMLRGALRKDE